MDNLLANSLQTSSSKRGSCINGVCETRPVVFETFGSPDSPAWLKYGICFVLVLTILITVAGALKK